MRLNWPQAVEKGIKYREDRWGQKGAEGIKEEIWEGQGEYKEKKDFSRAQSLGEGDERLMNCFLQEYWMVEVGSKIEGSATEKGNVK